MTCAACSARVERFVGRVAGVKDARVNLFTNTMTVEYDPDTADSETLIKAVERAGYGARLISDAGATADMAPARASGESDSRPLDTSVNDVSGSCPLDFGGLGIDAPGSCPLDAREAPGSRSHNTRESGVRESDARRRKLEAIVADPRASRGYNSAERQIIDHTKGETLIMKKRLIISLCFLLPLMYIAMGHMIGLPLPAALDSHHNGFLFAFAQFLLCLPIIRVNEKFFTVGFGALARGGPNMDSLIALGSSAAVVYGLIAVFLSERNPDLYFESAAMILTLITLGKYLETKTKGSAGRAVAGLLDLAPQTAVVVLDDKEYEIPAELAERGDIIALRPGSKAPVDGTVVQGNSSMDESALTGESMPVEKGPGDTVSAATINKAGFLLIRAERVGADTALARIIRLVEEAGGSKAPISRLADRISGIFVPTVLGISILTAIGWLLSGSAVEFALSNAIAVLVISCPCALGLATPAAIVAGTGRGAQKGILIKSAEALEKASAINTVVFDKTGTLTKGEPKVVDIADLSGMGARRLLELAASLEKPSEHPLAEAIVREGEKAGLTLARVDDFQAAFGMGVRGFIDGKLYWAGNDKMMEQAGVTLTDVVASDSSNIAASGSSNVTASSPADIAALFASQGKTPMYIADEEGCLGVIAIADEIKPTSATAVRALGKMGIGSVLLTGDNAVTADAVARSLGIGKVIAQALPEDKYAAINALRDAGQVTAMIGDGINDAPALIQADIGIAIAAGTNVAIESADIVLTRSDPLDAVAAIQLSKAVTRIIRQNLFWAFFYNVCGIPLAAGLLYGWLGLRLSPMFAAAAMSASSVSVVSNALRLNFFNPDLNG